MGARKRNSAKARKEKKKKLYIAQLKDCPTSPRKMRLVANSIRGKNIEDALNILKFTKNAPSVYLEKLLLSATANWQHKNEGVRIEDSGLCVKKIFVDSAKQLKRMRPAPHGRAYRIRKRSNHVTIILDSKNIQTEQQPEKQVVNTPETTDLPDKQAGTKQ